MADEDVMSFQFYPSPSDRPVPEASRKDLLEEEEEFANSMEQLRLKFRYVQPI